MLSSVLDWLGTLYDVASKVVRCFCFVVFGCVEMLYSSNHLLNLAICSFFCLRWCVQESGLYTCDSARGGDGLKITRRTTICGLRSRKPVRPGFLQIFTPLQPICQFCGAPLSGVGRQRSSVECEGYAGLLASL